MSIRVATALRRVRVLAAVAVFAIVTTGLAACASPSEQALRGPVWALTATTSTLPAFQGVMR